MRAQKFESAPMFPPNRDPSSTASAVEGCGWEVRTSSARKGLVSAMNLADGLGSGCGVRRLPSSYASSRVALPARTACGCGAGRLCAQSGNPRSSALDGPKREAPTTLNARRTVGAASWRVSIRCFTVGEVLGIAGGLQKQGQWEVLIAGVTLRWWRWRRRARRGSRDRRAWRVW